MKDRNADEHAKARADRWIAWEAAFIGLLMILGLGGVLYNFFAALV